MKYDEITLASKGDCRNFAAGDKLAFANYRDLMAMRRMRWYRRMLEWLTWHCWRRWRSEKATIVSIDEHECTITIDKMPNP